MIDRELPLALAHEAFDGDGALLDQERTAELDEIVAELLGAAALSGAGSPVLVNR